MADTVRVVEYFYVTVPDKPGEGARVLRAIRDAGVNLVAFSGFPSGRRSQLDFFPDDAAAFKRAAKAAGLKLTGPKRGILVQGGDRPGVVADLVDRLASAKINVTALDAVCADGRYGAILWVAPRDVKKAASLLGSRA